MYINDAVGEVLAYIFFIYIFTMAIIGSGAVFSGNSLTIFQLIILGIIGGVIGGFISWLIYNG